MSTVERNKRTEKIPIHIVLREVYRHYYEFEAYVAATGEHVIEHAYPIYEELIDEDGEICAGDLIMRIPISISFYDLRKNIEDPNILSERKRQAVLLNIILDMKQKDAAELMSISTVSVGQYVEQAMTQLAKDHFPELVSEEFEPYILTEDSEDLAVGGTALQ